MDTVRIGDNRVIIKNPIISPHRPIFYLTISPPGEKDFSLVDEFKKIECIRVDFDPDSQGGKTIVPGSTDRVYWLPMVHSHDIHNLRDHRFIF